MVEEAIAQSLKDVEVRESILQKQPDWTVFVSILPEHTKRLRQLSSNPKETYHAFQLDNELVDSCMCGISVPNDWGPAKYILTVVHDMIREDSTSFSFFDEAIGEGCNAYAPCMQILRRPQTDTYCADKAAWLITSLISHMPQHFTENEVHDLVLVILRGRHCTSVGALEAIVNLLKASRFRARVWDEPGVSDRIFEVKPSAPTTVLYRFIFAIWMLSFDEKIANGLKNFAIVRRLKEILGQSRVEKIVRLCLVVLQNFLKYKSLCVDIAEEGLLEVVQPLEYEKWRDLELYDDIRDLCQAISTEVGELSNFERYEHELNQGFLHWGYIHSSKFWAENVMKFEQNDWKALNMLLDLVQSPDTDATTLAVACHDIGEFVQLHPRGKIMVGAPEIKRRIMEVMVMPGNAHREARREALLCCQKIILNKWQDIKTQKK